MARVLSARSSLRSALGSGILLPLFRSSAVLSSTRVASCTCVTTHPIHIFDEPSTGNVLCLDELGFQHRLSLFQHYSEFNLFHRTHRFTASRQ